MSQITSLRMILNDLSYNLPIGTRQKKTTNAKLDSMRDTIDQTDALMLIFWEAQRNKVRKAALSRLYRHVKEIANHLDKYNMLIEMIVASQECALECTQLAKKLAEMEIQDVHDHFSRVTTTSEYMDTKALTSRADEFESLLCQMIADSVPNHRIIVSAMTSGVL